MDEEAVYNPMVEVIDLFIQQGNINQLVAFYKFDRAARAYIKQNINVIANRLGYPMMKSFQEIVTAYDKAQIDVMITNHNLSAYSASMHALVTGQSDHNLEFVKKSIESLLNYAFETGNLEVIKYALLKGSNFSESTFSKIVPELIDQFRSKFEKYPRLNLYVRNLIDGIETGGLASENSYEVRRRKPLLSRMILQAYLGDPTDLLNNYPKRIDMPLRNELRRKNFYEVLAILDAENK
ncbi:Hypothetical protein POVR1_LOCUS318 [uncultured virus]|nr:Hypothetical protein POVR1_LOCUS318 [uncultured virus]